MTIYEETGRRDTATPVAEATPRRRNLLKNVATGAGLFATGVATWVGEQKGINKEMTAVPGAVANSWAHVGPGFIAGLATRFVKHDSLDRLTPANAGILLAAGTAVDTALEFGQDNFLQIASPFYNNQFETGKDYVAALIGVGVAFAINRQRQAE